MAAKGGHCDIVKCLVGQGANISIKDQLGVSVLNCITEGRYPITWFNGLKGTSALNECFQHLNV